MIEKYKQIDHNLQLLHKLGYYAWLLQNLIQLVLIKQVLYLVSMCVQHTQL